METPINKALQTFANLMIDKITLFHHIRDLPTLSSFVFLKNT